MKSATLWESINNCVSYIDYSWKTVSAHPTDLLKDSSTFCQIQKAKFQVKSGERTEVTSGAAAHPCSGTGYRPAWPPRCGLVPEPRPITFIFFSFSSFNLISLLVLRFWFLEQVSRQESRAALQWCTCRGKPRWALVLPPALCATEYLKPTYIHNIYPKTSAALVPTDPPAPWIGAAPSVRPGRLRAASAALCRGAPPRDPPRPGPARLGSGATGRGCDTRPDASPFTHLKEGKERKINT